MTGKGKGGKGRKQTNDDKAESESKKTKPEVEVKVEFADKSKEQANLKNDDDYEYETGSNEDREDEVADQGALKDGTKPPLETKTQESLAAVIVPSPAKQPTFELIDSDDDEASGDDSDDEDGAPKCYITLFRPEGKNVPTGFAIHMDGYADKVLADILFNTKSKNIANFKKFIGAVGRVVKPTNSEGNELKNPNGFAYRALLVLTDGEKPTETSVNQWYKDTFLPAFKKVVGTGLRDNQFPVPDKKVRVVKSWQEFLGLDDFKFVMKRFNVLRKKAGRKEISMDDYLVKSTEHLYSFFKVGTITKALVRQYNIPQALLDKKDVERLTKKKAKQTK